MYRAVFIWNTKDWKGKEHKYLRQNIELDHANLIKWAPNSKALIINRATENQIEIYKVNKTDTWITCSPSGIKFPKIHEDETISIGISVRGKYMMSCSASNQLTIWDLKGTVLETIDTYLINTNKAQVSPCGRFVAASGFAPDVKVWEVIFKKTGEFSKVSRAFELKGHSAGVHDFGFNCDSSKMATVSKDGTWKVFNTKIEFEKGEDPHLILTGSCKAFKGDSKAKLAFSPNGEVVAIACKNALALYSALTGECDAVIEDIYQGPIHSVMFDAASELLLTSGEKHVRVFHNVTGRRTAIATAKQKLQSSANSAATKERLQIIIKEAEQFLANLGEKP
ncbi:LOW QUALITY PROTEIN: transducin beta-like protein 2 [Nilaparvata lugens]|uniref:LOW QUALITY PROTEIN: transducin beta-like protein 2 n=1 Tax=Nilaparvata lugens TaxID=108931 RepID=UPI00193EA7E8|nr:LOW QUALITY PROTEIN: transducin beta-like protein 2 [Nilaparvata lugens]